MGEGWIHYSEKLNPLHKLGVEHPKKQIKIIITICQNIKSCINHVLALWGSMDSWF